MNVQGNQITEIQIAAMLEVMGERFRASDLISAAENAGITSREVAMRAADRLLQKQRKANKIQIIGSGPYWKVVN